MVIAVTEKTMWLSPLGELVCDENTDEDMDWSLTLHVPGRSAGCPASQSPSVWRRTTLEQAEVQTGQLHN